MSEKIAETLDRLKSLELFLEKSKSVIKRLEEQLNLEKIIHSEAQEKIKDWRAVLVKLKLEEKHLNWCTLCLKIFPEDRFSLMLVEGVKMIRQKGLPARGQCFFSILCRACLECDQKRYPQLSELWDCDQDCLVDLSHAELSIFQVKEKGEDYFTYSSISPDVEITHFPKHTHSLPDLVSERKIGSINKLIEKWYPLLFLEEQLVKI